MGTDIIAEREKFLSPEPTVYTSQPARGSLLLVRRLRRLRACLHGGGGPLVGEVTCLGGEPACPYNLS